MQKLTDDKLREAVQLAVEDIQVALGEQREARQVDAREREVAAAACDFALGIVHVAHDARAAAHVGDLRVVVAGLVILEVERRVEEAEIRKQALRRRLHREAEEVVVRIALVIVHAILDLEDLHGEDRRLAVAESLLRREQEVLHDHAAFGRRVRAVVDRAERHLCARARVHRVEVVYESLHRLEGRIVRRVERRPVGVVMRARRELFGNFLVATRLLMRGQEVDERRLVDVRAADRDAQGQERAANLLGQELRVVLLHAERDGKEVRQLLEVELAEGLPYARRHRIVEVRDRLSAVHLVLVRLDGDAAERGIGADVVRFAQVTVPRREAVLEELQEVDLAARFRQHVEILVVDMDVAVDVRRRDVLGQDMMVDEVFRSFRTIFEHCAHRRIGVDVRILALDVGVLGTLEGQLIVDVHEVALGVTDLRMFRAIEDVRFRRRGEIVLDEDLFHSILNELDGRRFLPFDAVDDALRELFKLMLRKCLVDGLKIRLADGVGDLLGIKRHDLPRTLLDVLDH